MGIIRNLFPLEVLSKITQYLSIKDIKKLMGASEAVRRVIEMNPVIWKQKLKEKDRHCANGNYLAEVKREFLLTQSWIKNNVAHTSKITHVANTEITKIGVYGDIVIVSSNSSYVYVLDKSLVCIRTLKQHKGSIWAFDYSNNILVSGSTDKSIKVWDVFLGACIRTLFKHKSTIRSILLSDKYVVSGSRDFTVCVWDVKTGGCVHVLEGHTGSIRDMVFAKKKPLLVTGSYDGTCILWNYHTGEGIRCLIKLTRRIYKVECVGDFIAVGGMDQRMHVVTLDGDHIYSTPLQNGTIFQIKRDSEGYVYTLTATGTVSKWSIEKQLQIYQIDTHTKAIDICVINHLLIVGLIDRIDLYCREAGTFIRTIAVVDTLYTMYSDNSMLIYGYKDCGISKIASVRYGSV
ncbi:F-box and WD-40 domain protein 7 [Nematocida ausubeli]|nr:F-box and WD-40 domain protein 7 [Nematocida ausubeli]